MVIEMGLTQKIVLCYVLWRFSVLKEALELNIQLYIYTVCSYDATQ